MIEWCVPQPQRAIPGEKGETEENGRVFWFGGGWWYVGGSGDWWLVGDFDGEEKPTLQKESHEGYH